MIIGKNFLKVQMLAEKTDVYFIFCQVLTFPPRSFRLFKIFILKTAGDVIHIQ